MHRRRQIRPPAPRRRDGGIGGKVEKLRMVGAGSRLKVAPVSESRLKALLPGGGGTELVGGALAAMRFGPRAGLLPRARLKALPPTSN